MQLQSVFDMRSESKLPLLRASEAEPRRTIYNNVTTQDVHWSCERLVPTVSDQ